MVKNHWIDRIAVYREKAFLVIVSSYAERKVFILESRNVSDVYVCACMIYLFSNKKLKE